MILKTVLAIVLSLIATQAVALPCADSTHIENQLMTLHGQVLSYSGRLDNSNMLQLFMNPLDESWSLMVQVPNRELTCMVSTGYGQDTAQESATQLLN
jgi:hypothetical protein